MDVKKIPHNSKRLVVLLAALILAITAVFLGKPTRLPEQTVICGIDMSGMTLSGAKDLLTETVSNYSVKVAVGAQTFTMRAEDIGLSPLQKQFKIVVKTAVKDGNSPDPWSVITLDRDMLISVISQKFDEQRTAAVAPAVAFDEDANCFRAIAGEPETWYSRNILEDQLIDALAELPEKVEIPADRLYQEYTDPQLRAAAESLASRANHLMEQELVYKFRPRNYKLGEITLDGDTIASFLRFDVENARIYTDTQAVSTFVEYIAPKYKYDKGKDRFLAHDGARLKLDTLVQPQTVDTDGFARLIDETITAGSSGSFNVPYQGARNFDGTYIEASIPEQHLWYYENDVLIMDTPIVTGFEGIGRFTPVGLNYVRGHLTNIELFADSFVEYCMAFTTGGQYCFHDADHWREPEEYGGVTYQSHGSGGCVNVPVANMAKLFEVVKDGTPVMIHHYYHYDNYSFPG